MTIPDKSKSKNQKYIGNDRRGDYINKNREHKK